jgi:septal ring factor EnvC (AmiA/AmiB activator)
VIGLCLLLLSAAPSDRSILSQLDRLDRDLSAAEMRLSEIAAESSSAAKEIAGLEAELAATRVRANESFARFKRRVRALARMPAGERLVLLGGSSSLADYLETTRVLRWVAEHDRHLHRSYIDELGRLQTIRDVLQSRSQGLADLEAEQRLHRDRLAEVRRGRLALAESVVKRRDLAARVAVERSEAGRALASMVRKLSPRGRQSRHFGRNKGRLPWPAVGPLDLTFGQRVEHTSGTVTSHNGYDIRAAAGTPVQAVAAGQVVFANWLRGYGQVVILDHGEEFHTLCAHLGSIAIEVGDELESGAGLGTVGDTGSLRGTVLYFEIRHRGVPVDPRDWLRR